jgi:putative sigma-54 modulation protein
VQVKISIRHGHLNDSTQKVIREKAEKLNHLFDRLTLIQVTIDLKGVSDGRPPERSVDADRGHGDRGHGKTVEDKCRVEFLVQAEHKHDFVAHESHPEVLAAVDLALAKLQSQLRRYKEKIQDHRRTPAAGDRSGGNSNAKERVEEPSDQ